MGRGQRQDQNQTFNHKGHKGAQRKDKTKNLFGREFRFYRGLSSTRAAGGLRDCLNASSAPWREEAFFLGDFFLFLLLQAAGFGEQAHAVHQVLQSNNSHEPLLVNHRNQGESAEVQFAEG